MVDWIPPHRVADPQAARGDLQTYAIRFASAAFDETEPQRRMVRLLGTRHHEILCGSADIRESLPDVIWHTETPLLRTAPVPLFRLSDLVRTHGMKVVLTGEGPMSCSPATTSSRKTSSVASGRGGRRPGGGGRSSRSSTRMWGTASRIRACGRSFSAAA